jgi:hypothetical protein
MKATYLLELLEDWHDTLEADYLMLMYLLFGLGEDD